jgi:ATP-dependent DNA helicase DinG
MSKLDAAGIIGALYEGGSVASRLEHFEPRQAQLDLMKLIIDCFNDNAIGAAEAGTGVGKSFAYLLPALHFAAQTDERVVISTATITLQQQLFGKDIPFVQAAIDSKVKVVLVKGRGNYLCLRRLDDTLREPDLAGDDEQEEINSIARWAETSKSGGRDELPFPPSDDVWSKVCSDAEVCMGKHCPWQSRCFVLALRREAASAGIVVVNHHLFFADLAARREGAGYSSVAVLPPYSRVIIDEAHTIEDAATSFFSKEFARPGILRHCGRLYRKRRNREAGLLIRICSMLPSGDTGIEKLVSKLEGIRSSAAALDAPALDVCGYDGVYRFSGKTDAGTENSIFPVFADFRKKLLDFTADARELIGQLPESAEEDSSLWEVKAILRRFDGVAGICGSFTDYRKNENEVMWVERRKQGGPAEKSGWAVFTQSPVDLAESLRESLFKPHKTVVCVSATLAVNGSFGFWAVRSGLGQFFQDGRQSDDETGGKNDDKNRQRPFYTGCFPSPFPYSSAVLLAVPADAPLPDEQAYQDFVNRSVGELVSVAGGSALVLFTSYQSLNSAWNWALPALKDLGIRCLKQGDDDRTRLLQTFLADESSVLFATSSFWEGVDAPGDTLRLVILCRLPFRPPNDPVFEARREALEKNGGNSFMDLSLPEAVTKFKQGFGRLMRRSGDRGVVAVLDGRLIKKRYGELFLQSLPETGASFSSLSGILQDMESFLF